MAGSLSDSDDITSTTGDRIWIENGFNGSVWVVAIASSFVLVWMTIAVLTYALPAIKEFGFGFLIGSEWDPRDEALKFGALPFIYGTLISSLLAILIAVPLGIAVAIVTSENFLPTWVRSPISAMVELIAAIPSVIIGLWGIFVLVPTLLPLQLFLYNNFKFVPIFSTEPLGFSMFSAGVVLAIMIVPLIASISREVLSAVPPELRSASMALGATRWETITKILLPTAASGILGSVVLGLGRALGETMAVTMVIGNSTQIDASLLAPGYTIPAVLANQFGEALDQLHIGALLYLGLILFAITLIVNIFAVLLVEFFGLKRLK